MLVGLMISPGPWPISAMQFRKCPVESNRVIFRRFLSKMRMSTPRVTSTLSALLIMQDSLSSNGIKFTEEANREKSKRLPFSGVLIFIIVGAFSLTCVATDVCLFSEQAEIRFIKLHSNKNFWKVFIIM